jgi:hypothetical protein
MKNLIQHAPEAVKKAKQFRAEMPELTWGEAMKLGWVYVRVLCAIDNGTEIVFTKVDDTERVVKNPARFPGYEKKTDRVGTPRKVDAVLFFDKDKESVVQLSIFRLISA